MRFRLWGVATIAGLALALTAVPEPAGACSCATAALQADLVEVRLVSGSQPDDEPPWPASIAIWDDGTIYATDDTPDFQLDYEVR